MSTAKKVNNQALNPQIVGAFVLAGWKPTDETQVRSIQRQFPSGIVRMVTQKVSL